jgi:XRE family aerobic/anaerobic benzoate catabolism transcriptional regulator
MAQFDTSSSIDDSRTALMGRLAQRVRDERNKKGLPRRVVSERSGVSPRYLAQLEAGEGNISIALLERVAGALDVPIEALIAQQQISADSDAQRIAQQFSRASADVRRQIVSLLEDKKWADIKAGRICLLGLRGAGKTTLGRLAAKALGTPFVELDSLIEGETGMPVAEVLSLYGVDGLRRLEAEALERVIKTDGPMILSVPVDLVEQARPFGRLLARFHTVWLQASAQEHVMRVRNRSDTEATLADDEPQALAHINALMLALAPEFARAQATLDTSGQGQQSAARALVSLMTDYKFIHAD